MKLINLARITADYYHNNSLKEWYWNQRAALERYARLFKSANRPFAHIAVKDLLGFWFGTVKPVAGATRERADAAVRWLLRAQQATADDGVSLGYFPCDKDTPWRPSYPETTGYIVQSLLDYADRYGDSEVGTRALRMALWETEIQLPSGAVQGGPVCPPERQLPAVFNTGMVLQGYTAALRAGWDERLFAGAQRAAEFLVNDMGEDGHFRTHGAFVAQARIKTYNCLCAWALYRFGEDSGAKRYQEAALRAVEAALGEQQSNGWFANNCLTWPKAPLLHTLGYTLQGILEVGSLAGREDFIQAVRRGTDPILARMLPNGFLYGRYYSDWEPANFSSCLTGNAQLAIVCYRLFEITDADKYRMAADKIVNFLKALQCVDSADASLNGALAGSFPIFGSYMTTGYPNWATKYLLDSLLLQEKFSIRL